MEDFVKLIQALSAAAWPALVSYVVLVYRKPVAAIIESMKYRKTVLEIGGQKLSIDEASEQQQAFISDLQTQLNELRGKVEGFQIPPSVSLAKPQPEAPPSNFILWVDDNPKNNSYFIELLQKRGYHVDTALSTSEGLSKVEQKPYRLILSDMSRFEGGQSNADAGIDLLMALKGRGIQSPFVVFCSKPSVSQYRNRVKELGGQAITSSSTELRAVIDQFAPAAV